VPQLRPLAERPALRWLAVAVGYYAFARFSDRAGLVHDGVPVILPAQGVAFVAVQLGGPWLATAVVVGAVADGFTAGRSIGVVALVAAAAASAGLVAYAVTRLAGCRPRGERFGDTFIRIGGAAAASVVAASFQFGADALDGRIFEPEELWVVLLLANVAGILVVAPFVRAWIQRVSWGTAGRVEWPALVVVTVGVSVAVDTGVLGASGPSEYFLFPIVIWAALRAGRLGVGTVVFVSALIAMETTSEGRGPFVGTDALASAVTINSFLVVLALTGLLLVGLEQARSQTQTGLSEAEDRHRTLLDQLPLVTYMRSLEDIDLPPLYTSRQTEDLFGYPIERWLSEPRFASTLVHPDDREFNAELNARSLTEDIVRGEYRMIRADGGIVWILDHMAVVRNAAGEPVAQQGFVVDISERKALEEQLGQAQRLEALGLLAGGIAHDFNNLLTAITGYTGLALEHGGRENELVRRDLAEVTTAAGRAADLTRQLLAFGRRQVLERTVVDLNAVVIEAQSLLDRVIGEQITVVTELDPNLVRVQADTGQLGQVLVNLAVNARDAMPDGGTLTIATSNENGSAVVTVTDTGHGMDEQTRVRVFEPFFSTKPVGEGTGLGLAMVHGIVQQSGGQISVESSPGSGATIRIVLPGTQDAPPVIVAPVQSSPRGSETILLVEDEDIVRRLIAVMLEGQGYHVLAAAGPLEALEVTEPFDLLLTDVVMPSMSGPELAERMVERKLGVGVLFTSGYSGAAVADRSSLTADLLEKPFTIEQLSSKVRQALDARLSLT
jgi:PAS domain S-box-containing protein